MRDPTDPPCTRDPRVDPVVGDTLDQTLDGRHGYHRVISRDGDTVGYTWAGFRLSMPVETWREKMAGAAVIS